ncbi:MAG: hypothetical protein M1321_01845, partial [Candidatus Marsarchaeota archaeon]|nr:hypothetical protein [Candidatus Marsarchaeota archaeon]
HRSRAERLPAQDSAVLKVDVGGALSHVTIRIGWQNYNNPAGFIFGMFGNMIKKDRGSRYG